MVEPFDYSEYIEQQKKQKLEKEFAGQRITVRHFLLNTVYRFTTI